MLPDFLKTKEKLQKMLNDEWIPLVANPMC